MKRLTWSLFFILASIGIFAGLAQAAPDFTLTSAASVAASSTRVLWLTVNSSHVKNGSNWDVKSCVGYIFTDASVVQVANMTPENVCSTFASFPTGAQLKTMVCSDITTKYGRTCN